MSYKKPPCDPSEFGVNPFISSLIIEAKEIVNPGKFVFENGKYEQSTSIIEVELASRVYIRTDKRKYITALPPNAKALLFWIVYELEYNQDYLWINGKRYMEESKTSLNTYKAALKELSFAGIITPVAFCKEHYWINPWYIYLGNRIEQYEKCLVVYKLEN